MVVERATKITLIEFGIVPITWTQQQYPRHDPGIRLNYVARNFSYLSTIRFL